MSIHQPYERPMACGKASAKTEFGSKLTLSIDGYSILAQLSWDAYHEGRVLPDIFKDCKERFGFYQIKVTVDKIFMSKENNKSLKDMGARLISRLLDKSLKGKSFENLKNIRTPVEGRFEQGKRTYRLVRFFYKADRDIREMDCCALYRYKHVE